MSPFRGAPADDSVARTPAAPASVPPAPPPAAAAPASAGASATASAGATPASTTAAPPAPPAPSETEPDRPRARTGVDRALVRSLLVKQRRHLVLAMIGAAGYLLVLLALPSSAGGRSTTS